MIVSPRWIKVIRDLWSNKTRTALVVLSIAVGVFAIGAIAGARQMISAGLTSSYLASNPASAMLFTEETFDDDLVQTVRRMPEVAEAEARSVVGLRVQVGDRWKDMSLTAVPDYDDMRISTVEPLSGDWPPDSKELFLEEKSLEWLGVQVGDTLTVKTIADNEEHIMQVAGVIHDSAFCPPFFCQVSGGMIDLDTVEWLGEERDFNQINIVVAENAMDRAHITDVTLAVEDKIEKGDRTVVASDIPTPGKHPLADTVNTLILLLGVLGMFTLLLSGFLVVNTISALLTQQIRQIGVMKSIGAQSGGIMAMYLVTVVIFGLLALLIAMPLGALGARAFAEYNAHLFNFDIVDYAIPPAVLGLQVLTALIVPLVAALVPIFKGTRVTIREAMSDSGLGAGNFGAGWIDQILERIRGLSRPFLLALRNTFRRKGRLGLTLTTLILAGAIFIAVISVRASVALTLQEVFTYYNSDVFVITNKLYRLETLTQVHALPGVADVEGWSFHTVRRERSDESRSNSIELIGLPTDTRTFNPKLVAGRWLMPGDENAIVANTELIKDEPDIDVGDTIELKVDGKETTWHVVGIVEVLLDSRGAYVNKTYLDRLTSEVGKAAWVNIVLDDSSAAAQERQAQIIAQHFEREDLQVMQVLTAAENIAQAQSQFDIIIVLLLLMAVLLAIVGGLGLMGTMSMNILERTREIGVMRAIGASDGALLRMVIGEGMLVGALSWIVSSLLALPASKLLSDAVGWSFVQTPLSFTFSLTGVLVWLAVILALAALASWLPARKASRITVRDALAYE